MNTKQTKGIEIENPSKYMTLTYAVSLTIIALLSGAVHLMLDQVIEQQSQTGKIVNISGQQRMLSQRAGLFVLHHLQTGSHDSKLVALDAVDKMLINQNFLLQRHKENQHADFSAELNALYFNPPDNVQQNVIKFADTIKGILTSPNELNAANLDKQKQYVVDVAKTSLLESLHSVVEQYEKESLEKVDELRFAQNVVFWIIIFTILIEAIFIFRPMVAKVTLFASKLQREANYDALSGIFNRRAFNLQSAQQFNVSRENDQPLSVLMCDVDFFKNVNDTYGHSTGDEVIKRVAQVMLENTRNSDVVARYGGEEFIALLPRTSKHEASIVAEKIRRSIEGIEINIDNHQLRFTISVGISDLKPSDTDIANVILRADEALYNAKESGRNQVILSA
ncbi:putative diguanylate cyclase DgcQ [Paraglaciecola mesophila]|uniref:diguanylate cyclase n=1 Tax=Paraglaciecola mesophila TaxID=197222 RepID=A0A857JS25_9ALTE|nr:diguanylate cyclase [Paraglaciecola mesophila]QHJ13737.1 putative diguanylate cyclase DgcQ [Paraglaciecola mesophila]